MPTTRAKAVSAIALALASTLAGCSGASTASDASSTSSTLGTTTSVAAAAVTTPAAVPEIAVTTVAAVDTVPLDATSTSTSSTLDATTTTTTTTTTVALTPAPDTVPVDAETPQSPCAIAGPVTGASTGPDLDCVAAVLRSEGFGDDFGVDTAIRSFQASEGLTVDGVVGPVTATALRVGWTPPGAVVQDVDRVAIPAIGLDRKIVTGGQAQIDAGNVMLYTAGDFAVGWPGEGGTVWLAAHRSTHGSSFAKIPDLPDGTVVEVSHHGVTTSYTITARQLVDRTNPPAGAISGPLVLQTSWTGTQVWLLYGELTGAG
jgi:hypothetical protein